MRALPCGGHSNGDLQNLTGRSAGVRSTQSAVPAVPHLISKVQPPGMGDYNNTANLSCPCMQRHGM
ncbi:hypothetical protein CHLRE_02g117175v5 [Chlamydomonas reinhardtii]|uniref:Uncharacterized protein n=1 Tax=Chlamydomonas reinhardtii TaxID=3055 RepID=A0A2K3E3D7_CHLRE|nr:uncharacterized protein CHLRE_02g117175v5 [Chlamydomonas reinhardtii]PNW87302.1 hypothetical protein CHLRE_02g117175v5 [Chlamydomonas reinhardtii]